MPYKSQAQANYFRGCKHNPSHMKGKCPDDKTINEFENAEREAKKAVIRKGGK